MLIAKPDHLNLTPRTHMVQGRQLISPSRTLTFTCILCHMCIDTHTINVKEKAKIKKKSFCVVAQTYNLSTQKAETGGSIVQGQPELYTYY